MKDPNFSFIIYEILKSSQMSQTELAAQIGTSASTLSKLATGAVLMPKHDVGAKLLTLHAKVTKRLQR